MRLSSLSFLGTSSFFVAMLASAAARAQIDVNPPLPDMLLLIDSSGSMENMANGKHPEDAGASCVPGTTTPMNRWATLVSVLTGTLQNFSCFAQDRSSPSFLSEFSIAGVAPFDAKYYLPFHRILSNGCTYGPGILPASFWDPPAGSIKTHAFADAASPCAAPGFQQDADGLLDVYRDRVRFGLMTFDGLPHAGTGLIADAFAPNDGVSGAWSYYLGWNAAGSPAKGNPPGCATHPFEVGAKNPAAPPWEGGLVGFGSHDAPIAEVRAQNARIQSSLLALRPYGATPLAGMLADARDFLQHDTMKNPTTGAPIGAADDPYRAGGCREAFVLVLSDGEPNLDLRDACASGDGKCPYPLPWETAHELASSSRPIRTFAVGFGLASAGGVDCAALSPSDLLDPSGVCHDATGALRACCTLARVAYEGGTSRAYFASDLPTLRAALGEVFSIVSQGSTSRTVPVFASASASAALGQAGAAGYQFVSSFEAPPGVPWSGNLERKRYVCEDQNGTLVPKLQPIDPQKGDDFEANLSSGSPQRKLFTVVASQGGASLASRRSFRPFFMKNDGLVSAQGTSTGLLDGAAFTLSLAASPLALGIDQNALPESCKGIAGASPSASACAEAVVRWELGEKNVPMSRAGHELGAIYHASPAVMGKPNDLSRDESWAAFAASEPIRKRPPVLFAATTDGQLHAFQIAANDPADPLRVDTLENNELWSFFPPYVLPGILPTYGQRALLLDGSPVVRDVVFSRTRAEALAGSATTQWHTVLVGGGGMGGGFYYALDVTDPRSPTFLWQLSTDETGAPLFGKETPRPAITTILLDDGKGDVEEVAVAVLAGGQSVPPNGKTCPRITQGSIVAPDEPFLPSFGPGAARCHEDENGKVGPARSLTITRIDTGEILASFRGDPSDGPAIATEKVRPGSFDVPVTGIPVPYPAMPGQVADRIYIGDADGNLRRVDLSSPKPSEWRVDLAWDAHSLPGDLASARQPIDTPPVVSVDPNGRPVVLFSTGDQETFTSRGGVRTRLFSLLETEGPQGPTMHRNWMIPFENGERVTGPISLFDGAAYFATFTPTGDPGSVCSDGHGSIWGVDYLRKDGCNPNGPAPPTGFPCARYVADPVQHPGQTSYFEAQAPGTVVFGVAVTQTPSCYETVTLPDPHLGSVAALSSSSGGDFQLVFQTGRGGSASEGSRTNTVTKPLPRPRQTVRIDSWGAVLE